MPRTSQSHPLRVDWLPIDLPGRVGLTFAPGKKQADAATGAWDRDLDTDLHRLREEFGTSTLVCLLEDRELEELEIPDLVEAAASVGIAVRRLPIEDGWVPRDLDAVRSLVAEVIATARGGDNVVIHCKGGLGRAGTIGGCVLVAAGVAPVDALSMLKDARGPNCPETDRQRAFIEQFSETGT